MKLDVFVVSRCAQRQGEYLLFAAVRSDGGIGGECDRVHGGDVDVGRDRLEGCLEEGCNETRSGTTSRVRTCSIEFPT